MNKSHIITGGASLIGGLVLGSSSIFASGAPSITTITLPNGKQDEVLTTSESVTIHKSALVNQLSILQQEEKNQCGTTSPIFVEIGKLNDQIGQFNQ